MPYTKAHFYVLALLPVTILAFWQSYFGNLANAPSEHHFHGITGTAWLLLLVAQSWTIQRGHAALHRKMGLLVFVLTPAMIGAFALVTQVGANHAMADHPFYQMFGQALLAVDLSLVFFVALQVYLALRFRRNVRLHSALMLSTLVGLLPPILSRLFAALMPGMTIRGPDTLYRFEYCLALSMVVSVALGLWLYWRYRRDGWPWLLAAVFTGFTYLLYATLGHMDVWRSVVTQLAQIGRLEAYCLGIAIGLIACWLGWKQAPHQSTGQEKQQSSSG